MSHKRKVLQGSASNLVRVLLSMLVSMVLPPFLVHRMPPAEYSAWVLILQLSAYVGLLDFGLQAAIGKYVAEYDASGEREASHHLVSTSFTILALAAGIACLAIGAMVWGVPRLFHQMPATLVPEVRIALLAVGLSTAIALPFSTFIATFTGLQEYFFPTIIATISRVGSAALLIVLLLLHCSLVQLALVMAGFNLATAATQFFGWRRFLRGRVNFSFLLFHRRSAIQLAKYGSVISIWSLAMFFVSGLDTVIVGHYQYKDTGFYAIASGAANFMLTVIASVFGPLVPAVSSMQSGLNARPDWRSLYQDCPLLYVAPLPSRSATGIRSLPFAEFMGGEKICHTECSLSRSAGSGQCRSPACLALHPCCRRHRQATSGHGSRDR